MGFVLYNVFVVGLFFCVLVANVDSRAAFQTDVASEHLPSEDVEDAPSSDPLDSIFNEERFYEFSTDSSSVTPTQQRRTVNNTMFKHEANVSSTSNTSSSSISHLSNPISVNSTISKPDNTKSTKINNTVLSVSTTQGVKLNISLTVSHDSSTPSTLIVSTTSSSYIHNTTHDHRNHSITTSNISSSYNRSMGVTPTPAIRVLRTHFIEYSTPSDESVSSVSNSSPSVLIYDLKTSALSKSSKSSIRQSTTTNPKIIPLSSISPSSSSSLQIQSSILNSTIQSSSSSSTNSSSSSLSHTTTPIDDHPRVYQASTGLVSWENENSVTSTELLRNTVSDPISSQNIQTTTTNHEQHHTKTIHSGKTPVPDLERKTTRFLYSGFILPIVSGIIGAIIIALAIIMCRCCKRRKLKKVRYFGGKPKSDFVRLDRMNLLSDSSDYDEDD